jgi:ribonuclease P protein component
VFSKGRFFTSKFFLLKYDKNGLSENRFGFVTSTKVSGKAVERNLIKRRFREVIREQLPHLKYGYDIIFVIRKGALDIKYQELKEDILKSLKKSNLIK